MKNSQVGNRHFPSPQDGKGAWRRWAKAVRATAPDVRRAVLANLRAWEGYAAAQHVLIYLAFGDEIDVGDLQGDSDKTFYTTRTWQGGDELTLHPLTAGLEIHAFGYRQPRADAPHTDPALIDLALVPGLCFSLKGERIGYGKGYYDRLLPVLRPNAPRVGVTLRALIVPELPQDTFDQKVSHLLSGEGLRGVA